VSSDRDHPDVIAITFNNAESFIEPQNVNLTSIFDGFRITANLPIQMSRADKESQEDLQVTMNTFVWGSFVVGIFLKLTLQTMFSSINSLQVTAHVPLLNFNMPAKAYFIYDILI
jgi:hypothetical protein